MHSIMHSIRNRGTIMQRALLFTNSVLGAGICSTLEHLPDWSVTSASSQTLEEIVDLARDTGPEVTIFDTTLLNVLLLFQLLGQDRVNLFGRVIVATLWGIDEEETLFYLAMWGVVAHISASTEPGELEDILSEVTLGKYLLTSDCLRQTRVSTSHPQFAKTSKTGHLVETETPPHTPETASPVSPLTPREEEVLYCMAQGHCNKKIADSLDIGEQNVKNHNTSIFKKLQARNRTGAVARALQRGWISISEVPLNPYPDTPLLVRAVHTGAHVREGSELCYS